MEMIAAGQGGMAFLFAGQVISELMLKPCAQAPCLALQRVGVKLGKADAGSRKMFVNNGNVP